LAWSLLLVFLVCQLRQICVFFVFFDVFVVVCSAQFYFCSFKKMSPMDQRKNRACTVAASWDRTEKKVVKLEANQPVPPPFRKIPTIPWLEKRITFIPFCTDSSVPSSHCHYLLFLFPPRRFQVQF